MIKINGFPEKHSPSAMPTTCRHCTGGTKMNRTGIVPKKLSCWKEEDGCYWESTREPCWHPVTKGDKVGNELRDRKDW